MTRFLPESFDLSLIQHEFSVGDDKFVVTEASESAVSAFRNAGIEGVDLDEDGGIEKVREVGNADSVLLSGCLYFADKDGHLKLLGGEPDIAMLVPVERIRGMHARITKPLIEWVKEVSELDREGDLERIDKAIAKLQKRREKLLNKEKALKNALSATADTSE